MAGIEVVVAELRATAHQIDTAVTVIGEISNKGSLLAEQANAGGRPDVVGAIDAFLSSWDHGLSSMKEDAEAIAHLLQEAANAYLTTDSTIADAGTLQ